jgi:hypothetical protein
MNKLPISIGILGWNSNNSSLPNTLFSYLRNDFFNITDDITIFFQEIKEEDIKLANYFNIKYIGADTNVGIAKAFHTCVSQAKYDNFVMLEHDWYLKHNFQKTYDTLEASLKLVNEMDFDCVKLKHMSEPGFPDFVIYNYFNNPLEHYCKEIDLDHPLLLDTCHIFRNIHQLFPDKINQMIVNGHMFYTTTSRYGNYTNQPCLYKTKFYKDILEQFMCESDQLEGKVSKWWARQNFKVAHSEGLFTHFDIVKYAPYWEVINHFAREKKLFG